MNAPVTVSGQRLRAVAAVASEHRGDIGAHGLPLSLLADLKDLIGCDVISFEGFDSDRQLTWFLQGIRGDAVAVVDGIVEDSLEPVHWKHYWSCEPCSYPDRTGDLRTVITIGDFYSARQWHSTGMYADLYRPKGLEHELMLSLPARPGPPAAGPGKTLRLFLFRGCGRDFSDADRALLTLLRPHLYRAYVDAERSRHPGPELTSRHWEVLEKSHLKTCPAGPFRRAGGARRR